MNHAILAMSNGRYADGLLNMQKAAAWDPRLNYDSIYHYELGRVYGALHQTQNADYWAMLGDTLLQNNEGDNAVMLYRIGAKLPQPPLFRERFSTALQRSAFSDDVSGLHGRSMDKRLEAQAITPSSSEIIYSLAIQQTKIGNYQEAVPLWQRLITQVNSAGLFSSKFVASYNFIKPIAARSWSSMGYCYYKLGEFDNAMQCVSSSRELKGRTPELAD